MSKNDDDFGYKQGNPPENTSNKSKEPDTARIIEVSCNQKEDMLSDNDYNHPPVYRFDENSANKEVKVDIPTQGGENVEEKTSNKNKNKSLFAKVFPSRNDSTAEVLRKIVLIVCVLIMVVCVGIILNIYVFEPLAAQKNDSEIIDIKNTPNNSDIFLKYPNVDFPKGMNPEFASLYAKNNDFAGWLEIKGLGMEFAVVQAEDNEEYVRKNFYKQTTKYGCPFVDRRNSLHYLNRNTIIYGHNMSYDDLLFGKLEQYKTIEGFKTAPVIDFNTLFEDYCWKVYAVFISNADKEHDNDYVFNYIFTNVSSDEVFAEYIDELDRRKLYTTGVDINPSDKILTLSTCTYEFRNARLVIVARMVRENESTSVDTSTATKNNSVKYPQIWYDTYNNGKNPYFSAKKWLPR